MSTSHHPSAGDESQVRAEIEAWADSIRHKDVEGVLARFATHSIRFFLAPPLETEAPLRDNVESWFRTFEGPLGYELRQLTISARDGIAFTHSLNRITGTKTDGQKTNIWFRQTLGLHKIEGHWRITHIHDSIPFYMDGTYRAAADLQPTSLG